MADMDGIPQVERLDEFRQVVGERVEVVAAPRLARTPMPAPVGRDGAVAVRGEKNIWSSKASEVRGQPWLKTTGCPVPQSLK
jgi:hypothetical protein